MQRQGNLHAIYAISMLENLPPLVPKARSGSLGETSVTLGLKSYAEKNGLNQIAG
jgi:hypothetical protein